MEASAQIPTILIIVVIACDNDVPDFLPFLYPWRNTNHHNDVAKTDIFVKQGGS